MITRTEKIRQTPDWQHRYANSIVDLEELLQLLKLDRGQVGVSAAAAEQFSLRITREYVSRIRPGDAQDPLLRQILPLAAELRAAADFIPDPVGDHQAQVAKGVLHKYAGRVLLLSTGACAIHCRYCFRRHFPYAQANAAGDDWQEAMQYLRRHDDIHEVILSGGDPLMLADVRLAKLVKKIEKIKHIKTLRIHTRLPIILPQRVCSELLTCLQSSQLRTVMVVHCNHHRELDESVQQALHRLHASGVTLLNQAVLLKGVNNSLEALKELSLNLFQYGVLPYYLHMLDPVAGAAHFEVGEAEAQRLFSELQTQLPGYLLPRLVREHAGRPSKSLLGLPETPVSECF